jgi:hypothetical protein
MANHKKYIPQVGDLVMADGMNDTVFRVVEAPDLIGSTKVQPYSISKQILYGNVIKIPRLALRLFKEDASQAAARIVREVTEE